MSNAVEGRKVSTLTQTRGRLMITADLHGNWDDFARLREIFLTLDARGEAPVWVSVGDWVHGPAADAERDPITSRDGRPLYDYPDRSPDLVRALFVLMDQFPGRVLSVCGNHEHAHIGGPRTRKFHDDEAAFLEAQLSTTERDELRARLASWPLCVRVPTSGVLITHGAMAAGFTRIDELERIRYDGTGDTVGDDEHDVLRSAMTWYGFSDDEDVRLVERASDPGQPPYTIVVHGHDREESGYCRSGPRALMLCTSFGAVRERKAYVLLDLARRYESLDELREGHELQFLWST